MGCARSSSSVRRTADSGGADCGNVRKRGGLMGLFEREFEREGDFCGMEEVWQQKDGELVLVMVEGQEVEKDAAEKRK